MRIVPYLMFSGNCEEALEFYRGIFKGEAQVMRYSEAQGMPIPPGWENKVLHASLMIAGHPLYMSDGEGGNSAPSSINPGITLEPDSEEQQTEWFNGLAEGGQILMPLEDTFWGARFGSLNDKYGFNWSMNFSKTPQ